MTATIALRCLVVLFVAAGCSAFSKAARKEPDSIDYLLKLVASSRPTGTDPAFDCAWRRFAAVHAASLQAGLAGDRTRMAQLHDALELNALCGASFEETMASVREAVAAVPMAAEPARPQLPSAACVIYADTEHGNDNNTGSLERPVKSVVAAIDAARKAGRGAGCQVLLRAGTYVMNDCAV